MEVISSLHGDLEQTNTNVHQRIPFKRVILVILTHIWIFRGTVKGTYHSIRERGRCVEAIDCIYKVEAQGSDWSRANTQQRAYLRTEMRGRSFRIKCSQCLEERRPRHKLPLSSQSDTQTHTCYCWQQIISSVLLKSSLWWRYNRNHLKICICREKLFGMSWVIYFWDKKGTRPEFCNRRKRLTHAARQFMLQCSYSLSVNSPETTRTALSLLTATAQQVLVLWQRVVTGSEYNTDRRGD